MDHKLHKFMAAALATLILLTSCATPTPSTVEVTRVVTQQVQVTQQVEVPVTQEVQVTRVVAATESPEVADRRKTVVFDIEGGKPADSQNWNPYSEGRGGSQGLTQALLEPLLLINIVTGGYESWLAEDFTPNADFSVWTLKLRSGVEWSDGQSFGADDVVFTVEMLQKFPDLQTALKFKDVTVSKVDDLTVDFKLAGPDPRYKFTIFGSNLESQMFKIVPAHIWKDVADPVTFKFYDPAKGWPIYTGAYTLDKVSSDTEYLFKRNDNWWGKKSGFRELPAPEKLVFIYYGSEETRAAALAKDDLDMMAIATSGSFETLRTLNPNVIAWTPDPPFGWADSCDRNLEFNHLVKPWDDPDMRWAVAQAIDRQALIDVAFNGYSSPSYHFFANYPALQRYVGLLADKDYYKKIQTIDPEAAKAAFEAKGYKLNAKGFYEKDGQELAATVANFDDTVISALNGALVEQLQAVGINATQDIQPIPAFVDNLLNGKFQLYIFFGSCGSVSDPFRSMNAFNVSHLPAAGQPIGGFYNNSWRWSSDNAKQYSAIIDQIGKLQPEDSSVDGLFVKSMDYWYADLPGIPLVHNPIIWPVSQKYWTNWPSIDNAYIQPDFAGPAAVLIIHNLKSAQP